MIFKGIKQLKSLNSEKAHAVIDFEVETLDPKVLEQASGSDLQVTFSKDNKEIEFFRFFNSSTEKLVPVGLSDVNRSKLANFLLSVSL